MFNILLDCNDTGVLKVVYLIKEVLNIIQIVVPIILIISCLFSAIKNVTSNNGFDSKIMKKIGTNLLAAACVFLVPSIINITMSILQESNFQASNCWINATEDVMTSNDNGNNNILDSINKNIEDSLLQRRCLDEDFKNENADKCKNN